MDLMLRVLKIMIGISVSLVGLTMILSLAGATGLTSDLVESVVQLLAFVVLYYSVKSGYRFAIWLFVAFCLLTFFDGMTFEASLAGLFDALFAVLAFVGLAGAWHWRKDRHAQCPPCSTPSNSPSGARKPASTAR